MPIVTGDPTSEITGTFSGNTITTARRYIIAEPAVIEERIGSSTSIPLLTHVIQKLSASNKAVIEGSIKRIRRGIGTIAETFGGSIKVFVDVTISATPTARLYLYQADCPDFTENNLAGHTFTRTDYLAIGFKCCGDKMVGLQPFFQAGLTTGGVLMNKGPANMSINPIVSASSNEEHLTGMFSITEVDTASLPADTQSELIYRFWLSDGVGRNYTLEEGSLTVTPINVR